MGFSLAGTGAGESEDGRLVPSVAIGPPFIASHRPAEGTPPHTGPARKREAA